MYELIAEHPNLVLTGIGNTNTPIDDSVFVGSDDNADGEDDPNFHQPSENLALTPEMSTSGKCNKTLVRDDNNPYNEIFSSDENDLNNNNGDLVATSVTPAKAVAATTSSTKSTPVATPINVSLTRKAKETSGKKIKIEQRLVDYTVAEEGTKKTFLEVRQAHTAETEKTKRAYYVLQGQKVDVEREKYASKACIAKAQVRQAEIQLEHEK